MSVGSGRCRRHRGERLGRLRTWDGAEEGDSLNASGENVGRANAAGPPLSQLPSAAVAAQRRLRRVQYCSVTVRVDGGNVARVPEPGERREPERSFEDCVKIATATFTRVLESNGTPEQATWYAAHEHGGLRIDPAEAAHGAIALAHEFDAEHMTSVIATPPA